MWLPGEVQYQQGFTFSALQTAPLTRSPLIHITQLFQDGQSLFVWFEKLWSDALQLVILEILEICNIQDLQWVFVYWL